MGNWGRLKKLTSLWKFLDVKIHLTTSDLRRKTGYATGSVAQILRLMFLAGLLEREPVHQKVATADGSRLVYAYRKLRERTVGEMVHIFSEYNPWFLKRYTKLPKMR